MGDGVMNQSISSSVPFLFTHKRLSYCVIIIIILTISIFILITIAINAIVIILVKFLESLNQVLAVEKITIYKFTKQLLPFKKHDITNRKYNFILGNIPSETQTQF